MEAKKTIAIDAPAADPLRSIAAEGAEIEGRGLAHDGGMAEASPPAEASPASSPDIEAAAIWALIPQTFGSVLAMAMPELRDVYTAEACGAWGAAMVPVARKYGWNLTADSPELALLAASVPFAIGTYTAIAKRKAAAGAAPSSRPSSPASSPRSRPANVIDIAAQAAPTVGGPPDLSQSHQPAP